ncbi:N-acetylmuramic acid 6-phosphate etherase, partial [Enterobacter cloacae]
LSNRKLRGRAEAMVARIAGVDRDQAAAALDLANGRIKLAALLAMGADPATAADLLHDADDVLRIAMRRIS